MVGQSGTELAYSSLWATRQRESEKSFQYEVSAVVPAQNQPAYATKINFKTDGFSAVGKASFRTFKLRSSIEVESVLASIDATGKAIRFVPYGYYADDSKQVIVSYFDQDNRFKPELERLHGERKINSVTVTGNSKPGYYYRSTPVYGIVDPDVFAPLLDLDVTKINNMKLRLATKTEAGFTLELTTTGSDGRSTSLGIDEEKNYHYELDVQGRIVKMSSTFFGKPYMNYEVRRDSQNFVSVEGKVIASDIPMTFKITQTDEKPITTLPPLVSNGSAVADHRLSVVDKGYREFLPLSGDGIYYPFSNQFPTLEELLQLKNRAKPIPSQNQSRSKTMIFAGTALLVAVILVALFAKFRTRFRPS